MIRVNRGNKGFTLIELLIVVAIIGILAAIAIPAYTGYTAKARITEVVNSMGAIKNAVLAYYTESGTGLPANTAGAPAVNTMYGVNPASGHASNYVVAWDGVNTATITATIANISGVAGDLVLTGVWSATGTAWTWSGANGLSTSYVPKN